MRETKIMPMLACRYPCRKHVVLQQRPLIDLKETPLTVDGAIQRFENS